MPFDPHDLTIPHLPPALRTVPPPPRGPDDPLGADKRAAWFAWRDAVAVYRRGRWLACAVASEQTGRAGRLIDGVTGELLDPRTPAPRPDEAAEQRAFEAFRCSQDPAYFRAVWLATFETRGGWGRRKGWQPAIPYGFQVRAIRWLDWRRRVAEESDEAATSYWSKPRTVGATGIVCDYDLWGWRFLPAYFAKWMSRKEDLVDSARLDSLMARTTVHFDHKRGQPAGNPLALPRWLWPQGFDPAAHKSHLSLQNPENGNEINGEATTSTAGRGGRATVGRIDEASFIPGLGDLLSSMAETVGALLATSSESDEVSEEFGELVLAARERGDGTLLETDWWEHPHYTKAWELARRSEAEQRGNLDGFLRETWRKRGEGLSDRAYPMLEQVVPGAFPYDGAPVDASMDPGKKDKGVVGLFSRGLGSQRYRLLDAYGSHNKTAQFFASLLAGYRDPLFEPWYEQDPRALDFLRYIASLPPVRFLYGDPYGHTTHTELNDSWFSKMLTYWADNLDAIQAQRGLDGQDGRGTWEPPGILVNWKNDARGHAGRRDDTRELLLSPGLDFNSTDGAREVLIAMQRSKWRPDTGNRTTEQERLPHDKWSHDRSMVEYFAVNAKVWDLPGLDDLPELRVVA